MREKILRDKEMRRRQAAEEKTKDEVSENNFFSTPIVMETIILVRY